MPMVTNSDRAGWAAEALDTFSKITHVGRPLAELTPEEQAELLGDLICNLQHYARIRLKLSGPRRRQLIENALGTAREEVFEDPDYLPPEEA